MSLTTQARTAELVVKLQEKAAAADERIQQIQGRVLTRCRSASSRRDAKLAELRAAQEADAARIARVRSLLAPDKMLPISDPESVCVLDAPDTIIRGCH